MKKSIKILSIVAVVTLGFYNLNVSKESSSWTSVSIMENSASADSESGSSIYFDKTSRGGTAVSTHQKPDGSICTTKYDFVTVVCEGKGNVYCIPGTQVSNVVSNC